MPPSLGRSPRCPDGDAPPPALPVSRQTHPCHGHGPALQAFDEQAQACLEQIGGLPLTQNTWLQASLAIKAGGLGLRSTALHAPAAYIASITHLAASCTELDPTYRVVPPPVHQALTSYNQVVLPEDQIHSLAPSYQQRDLSATVDKAQQAHLIAATTGEAAKGHLQLVQQPGAGAWLTALPADNLGLHINTHLFRVLLRLRLRLPIAPSDGFCPLCDGVADSFGTTLEYAHVVETEANDITGCGTSLPPSWLPLASAQS